MTYDRPKALHSNLILFKSSKNRGQGVFMCGFTFQSGSIQIISDTAMSLMSRDFTFQSGSIQIS